MSRCGGKDQLLDLDGPADSWEVRVRVRSNDCTKEQ
jgi:hypothetical protein